MKTITFAVITCVILRWLLVENYAEINKNDVPNQDDKIQKALEEGFKKMDESLSALEKRIDELIS